MSAGYAITNALAGLAATAFTWSTAYTTGRDRLNDGKQDYLAASGGSAAANVTLVIDMGSATALVGFVLLNHNLNNGASCTVLVEGADDAAITTNPVTAKAATEINGTSFPNKKDTVLQFPSVTKRYWRLSFTYSGNRILTFGEILAFTAITTLSRQTIYGAGEKGRYVNNRNESKTGYLHSTFLAGPLREKTLPYKDLSTSQRDELLTMWNATRGGNSNLLWIETIGSSALAASLAEQECMWGKLQDAFGWTQADYLLFDVPGLTLVGLGREVGA